MKIISVSVYKERNFNILINSKIKTYLLEKSSLKFYRTKSQYFIVYYAFSLSFKNTRDSSKFLNFIFYC